MRPTPELMTAYAMLGATSIMAIPIARRLVGSRSTFLRNLGFASEPRATTGVWMLAIAVAGGYIAFTMRGVPLVAQQWYALSWLKLLSLALAITAGIVEEAFFRRMLMDALARAGRGVVIQIVVSALAFGIAHGLWGFFSGSFSIGFGAASATGVLGAALASIYVLGGRSLAPCIVAHALIDAVIEPGLLLAAVTGKMGH